MGLANGELLLVASRKISNWQRWHLAEARRALSQLDTSMSRTQLDIKKKIKKKLKSCRVSFLYFCQQKVQASRGNVFDRAQHLIDRDVL